MKPKRLFIALFLLVAGISAYAANVKVKMNAISTTMSLAQKGSGTPVDVGTPENKVYTFEAPAGEYTLTGYATDGTTVNGTLDITVAETDEEQEFTILTITAYVTNKHTDNTFWTIANGDYSIDLTVCTREGQVLNSVYGNSTTAGRNTFLALNGNSYYLGFVPSQAHQDEGYTTLYKSATLTFNTTAYGAIPLAGLFDVTVPSAASVQIGRKTSHFIDFKIEEPQSTTVNGDNTTYTYRLAQGQVYNYRTWMEGGLTQGGYFTMAANDADQPDLTFTLADYQAFNPGQINHDVNSNQGYETGDIFLNINERGQLALNVGDEYDLHSMRTWELIDISTNNYIMEPDFHYTVIGLDGQPSSGVVEIESSPASAWSKLKAVGSGTAIVLVTYDAIGVNYYSKAVKTEYLGGEYWGAIWPENTGVFVVTVGQSESGVTPNMVINEEYNTGALKMAGGNVDAEHDVFYYLDTESGAYYTFAPQGVESIEMAYPTIGAKMASYSGFSTEGVQKNSDGTYTLLLKEGRQIVKMTDASGHAAYQVLTAKPCHREISNASRPGSNIYQPGDNVLIQYSGLRHPANKIAGIYNMSAYVTYNGIPNGTSLILGKNQYTFGSAPSAQATTISIPDDIDIEETPTIDMTKGVIQVTGFGDPIGNHRYIDNIAGRSPNFTAVSHQTYFGQIPDVEIPLTAKKMFDINMASNVGDVKFTLSFNGAELTANAETGLYSGTYGTYSVVAKKSGYRCYRNSFEIGDEAEGQQTFAVNMEELAAGAWDGETLTEPSQEDGVYLISTAKELAWLANAVNNASSVSEIQARVVADIDLANFDWTPIGASSTKYFKGSIEGGNHAITGLYVNQTTNYAGLFGYVKDATISGLSVNGVVSGNQYVGAVAGALYGTSTIDRCSNHANVTGSSTYVGGVVGYLASNNASLTNSYNTGNISGTTNCGGVAGSNMASAIISNVYNIGNVSGTTVGACVGGTTGKTKVTNAFSTKEYGITASQTLVTEYKMRSGEVAYKLGEAFGQALGVDNYPVLGGMKVLYNENEDYYYNEEVESDEYDLAVLTFEDDDYKGEGNMLEECDWSSLIDNPQYYGPLLYGNEIYWWWDENNTNLYSENGDKYWSGGTAVSNYVSTTYENGGYTTQLEAYNPEGGKGGHNGSDNFLVCFGYEDDYSYGACPVIEFAEGTGIIDHLYINLGTYGIHSAILGDSFSSAATESDYVDVLAEALGEDDQPTGKSTSIRVVDGKNVKMIWTKWDLSVLGECAKVRFNYSTTLTGSYGLNFPAYILLDDIAVRVPKKEVKVTISDTGIATYCSKHNLDFSGSDVKAYAVTSQGNDYVKLTEVETVPAGMGVILQGEAGEYNVPVADDASYTGVNYMKGVTSTTEVPATEDGCNNYILARDKSNTVAFYPLSAPHTLAARKAYLSLSGALKARMRIIFEDEVTGIGNTTVDNLPTTGDCYNLQGVRVNDSYKGIVIKNGKKTIK